MIKRKYVLKLTRRGVAGFFLFIMFGALWIFVLGIFVGRNSIPLNSQVKDIKTKLASLKNEDEEKIHDNSHENKLNRKERLGFYEDLKQNKTGGYSKGNRRDHKTEAGKSRTEAKTSNQKQILTDMKQFTIQVASVKDEKTADRMVAQLKRDGYPAYKTDVTIPELGRWFRVRVGHYKTKDTATSAIERLKGKEFTPILLQE